MCLPCPDKTPSLSIHQELFCLAHWELQGLVWWSFAIKCPPLANTDCGKYWGRILTYVWFCCNWHGLQRNNEQKSNSTIESYWCSWRFQKHISETEFHDSKRTRSVWAELICMRVDESHCLHLGEWRSKGKTVIIHDSWQVYWRKLVTALRKLLALHLTWIEQLQKMLMKEFIFTNSTHLTEDRRSWLAYKTQCSEGQTEIWKQKKN